MRHVLVLANETVTSRALVEALERAAQESGTHISVVSPVHHGARGYVVYEDSRRAAARRRLDRMLATLRDEGISAQGFVVETDPVNAARDAIAQLEPPVTDVIVSTHPEARSGWLRRNVLEQIRRVAGDLPVEHVISDPPSEGGQSNVLVVANETVIGEPLLAKIRERAAQSPARFTIVSPQSDVTAAHHPEAERRLRRALTELRSAGVEAHGQVAHPDPFAAAMEAVSDERTDEIIVSTFPGERSGWLRRDLVERLRKETGLPVEHVVVEPQTVGASA